ncbi:hypothetical protein Thiosp_01298 [Thiorhodovibrio litoralis]|nr:hypothetical protein Thiosp_01298 [Thiorhodovibrio litoralis]
MMRGIVCNTEPLIALERVGLLPLFGPLFGHVLSPAAVIQLAQALRIDQVLIDDRKGRKIARDIYGLRTLGRVRVLLEANPGGLIDAIRQPLESMREHGYAFMKRSCRQHCDRLARRFR